MGKLDNIRELGVKGWKVQLFGAWKVITGPDFNTMFNMSDGRTYTWGARFEDDPQFCPIGPLILDIEVSTICNGSCSFCYKSNTSRGKNMTLDTFKEIFHKIPVNLTQIAFGIGALDANPDLWDIMRYCRENDYNKVVPNITINGIDFTSTQADKLVEICGAVAVSHYSDNNCFRAVKMLSDRGLKQVNIHKLLCKETLDSCFTLIDDAKSDERLRGLNAIVFLLMKPKGKRNKFHQLTSLGEYRKLIDYAFDKDVSIGFDSCSAPSFLKAIKGRDNYDMLEKVAEPCESTCFSAYIDVDGGVWPCSFCEDHKDIKPLNILDTDDFMDEVWNGEQYSNFRSKLLDGGACRECPVFDLEMK